MKFIPFLVLAILVITTTNSVYASGIRGDTDEGATIGESICWVNGYDSGFAGKFDKDRDRECGKFHENFYNQMWDMGCEDSLRTEEQCDKLKDNPVQIDNFKELKSQNDRTCYDAGVDDGRADRPFNEEREDGCYEFDDIGDGYKGGYQWGCEVLNTESTCELRYEEIQNYCPDHPDVAGCADFLLNNSTYKQKIIIENYDINACKNANATCYEDINPEKYCLTTDNPIFCNSIGDLCDEDGFVKPEYPYCQK